MNTFPFVAGAYQSRSPRFDNQRTVNLYPEASGSGTSKSIAMLIGTPGTQTWGTVQSLPGKSANAVRGMIAFNSSRGIFVGGEVVSYTDTAAAGGAAGVIGTIPYALTRVSMATNGQIVMLVTGTEGYFIDPIALTITQIVDPAFQGADVVWFINGRFVWNRPGTQIYQWSELYSTVIDPLAFASAEGAPDLLVSLIVDHKELWLLGESTAEVHINSGNPDQVFEPIQGAFIEQGCAAPFSVAKMTDGTGTGTVIWLSRNAQGQGMFVRTVGYQPQRISDHALEYQIARYSRIDDAIAYTYQQEGHSFYVVSFPTADKTWCYDTSTELWHERAYREPNTGNLKRHRSNCYMFFEDKHLVGDYLTDAISELRLDVYADGFPGGPESNYGFATIMPAIRQCPHLSLDDAWQFFHELWIDMETGVGLAADVVPFFFGAVSGGKDPSLILEWSDDGGFSFPYSREIKIGKIGERQFRAVARRLGKSRDRVFRVTITAPVKRVFINAGCRTSVAA
jgi:hypothetical protein